MIINDLFNNKKFVAEAIGDLGSKRDQGKTIRKWRKSRGLDEQGGVEGLNEFAPDDGGGESGRWYTDDQMTDIVGDGWYQDLDVSGDIPKQQMIQQAQAWLDDQGYDVQVLNCKINDDDMEWYIEGSFQNSGFAKKGMAEDLDKSNSNNAIQARQKKADDAAKRFMDEPKYNNSTQDRQKKADDAAKRFMQGVAEDDDAVAAFLARGGQVQKLKPAKPRKGERWQGSAHIGAAGGRGTKGQVSGLGANTGKSGKPVVTAEQGVAEAQTDYQKRRQRERDVDAGKPVKPEPKNPQNDYFARRKKEKDLAEVSLGDYGKKAQLSRAMAQTNRFFDRDDAAKVAAADRTIANRTKGLASADARRQPYTPPAQDAEKMQRDLTAKYPNIDELVAKAEQRRDPNYDYAEGNAYYDGREAEQNYQKLKQIQRVIQGLNESLQRTQP